MISGGPLNTKLSPTTDTINGNANRVESAARTRGQTHMGREGKTHCCTEISHIWLHIMTERSRVGSQKERKGERGRGGETLIRPIKYPGRGTYGPTLDRFTARTII